MYYPPRLDPNQTVYISDEKWLHDFGTTRFGAYSQEAVVYWPWLSWDTIDKVVGVNQQSAMPRATLIGQPPTLLFSIIPDGIGAIARFGREVGGQAWELIAYFDWYNADGTKKFATTWWTLWATPAIIPPAAEAIEGTTPWAGAPVVQSGVLYINTSATANPASFNVVEPAAGGYRLEAQHKTGNPSVQAELWHSVNGTPGLLGSNLTPTDFTVSNSASYVGIRFLGNVAGEAKDVQFRVTKQ